MRIESIELVGYKRFVLANIQSLVFTPESAFQLIIGTNGSGKSSLLQELSPLPPASGDFIKGGSKSIHIRHRGHDYVLTSTFKSGNHHSFVKDGQELNDGGTGQVQKELVRQEFNYTADLHELLIGRERFTAMSPMKRREWITRLSSADYTYALSVFNRLKTAARDAQGAVKHTKQRLMQETNNLRAFGSIDGLEDKANVLRNELTALLRERTPNTPSAESSRDQLRQHLGELESVAKQVLDRPGGVSDVYSSDQLADLIAETQQQLSTTRSLHQRVSTEYGELEDLLHSLGAGAQMSPEQIQRKLDELDAALQQLAVDDQWISGIHDAANTMIDTTTVLPEVTQMLQALPDNSDGTYSRETVQTSQQRLEELRRNYDSVCAKLRQIHLRLEHFNHTSDQECPQCQYRWKPGVDLRQQSELEQWQIEHTQTQQRLETEIRQLEQYLESASDYARDYSRLRTLLSSYPRLHPLIGYMTENRCFTDRPAEKIGVLHRWYQTVSQLQEREALQAQRRQFQELKERHAQLGEAGLLVVRQERLQSELQAYTAELESAKQRLQELTQFQLRYRSWSDHVRRLEELVAGSPARLEAYQQALRNRCIDQVVDSHHNELATVQRKLSEFGTLNGIVNDLNQDHDGLDRDWKSLLLLTQALSPTEGLIAEQLTGFIQCLVAQMNSVIAAVWEQDLKILPCGLDGTGLDYKFPLQSGAGDTPNDDIQYGSTAQVEIVNLAFKLTAMLYLGLTDYPLYLDELGAAFDEQHRINVMNFVKQLMEVNQHSQMFLISHYAASWGVFTGAQVLVLDGSNIAIPQEYNKHAVLL